MSTQTDQGRDTQTRESVPFRLHSSAGGNADLGRLQDQFDGYYQVLEDNGVRVNYIEPPVPAMALTVGSRTSSPSPAAAL
jgi:hypothetical protein